MTILRGGNSSDSQYASESAGAAITKYCSQESVNNRKLFLRVLEV